MPPHDDELKRLVLQNIELTRENNRLLRKLRRAEITRTIFSVFYWLAIILIPLYIYYAYLGPYLADLRASYEEIKGQAEKMQNVPEGLSQYLDKLEAFFPGRETGTSTSKSE